MNEPNGGLNFGPQLNSPDLHVSSISFLSKIFSLAGSVSCSFPRSRELDPPEEEAVVSHRSTLGRIFKGNVFRVVWSITPETENLMDVKPIRPRSK